MAKVTTVQDIRNYEMRYANKHRIPLDQARADVRAQWEMIAFLGVWSLPSNEVIVPNNMPVPGSALHAIIIS